ncbi:DUF935 domain-containing protein [Bowmanella dokdonensis]
MNSAVLERMADRQLLDLLHELPDPDPILRKANIDQEVYAEIMGDPHVLGEIRKMYSALVGYKYQIKAGDDSSQAAKAQELCQAVLKKRPHGAMRWPDLIWSFGRAPLTGRRVHHVEWTMEGSNLVPKRIFDIPGSSYCFNYDGDLMIRTLNALEGEPAEPMRWLVTRHMPDAQNPYGIAILSSCFWPWMFKNGGIKFFAKFCEKFGIPWPVGQYPQGSTADQINELVERLQQLVEDAVAAVPEGVEMTILETKASGELPQERLVNLMNREMSKAITSQSLATEIIGNGSRAAAETGDKRTDQNNKADRGLPAATINQLFEWITEVNFGPAVPAPIFQWVDKKELNTTDVSFFKSAAELVPIRKADVYERLELTEPADDDEILFLGSKPKEEEQDKAEFSKAEQDQWNSEDQAISDIIDQIRAEIDKGETLEQALANMVAMVPNLDFSALETLVRQELELDFGTGMLEAE